MYLLVCRENRSGCAELCTHVCDGRSLWNLKFCCSRSYILVYVSKTALDRNTAKHLKDHFFCIYTRFQFSGQINLYDSRHFESHRNSCHGCCHVHSSDTDAQHSNGAAVWCMAVTTHADLARCAESCYMYGMADTVSRSGYMYAEFLCC